MLRKFVQGLAMGALVSGLGVVGGAGCLDRPVTAQAPTIKTNFTSAVSQNGIDKVDILFDIDNSASMGDKQTYLIQAIPQMIARLVTPQCIDNSTMVPTGQNADPTTGLCPTGSAPEFTAVHDMHIGVITSSLGTRQGIEAQNGSVTTYICAPDYQVYSVSDPTNKFSAHNDDQGHLINRTGPAGSGPALANAALSVPAGYTPPAGVSDSPGGFLYWFPALGNSTTSPNIPPGSTITPETVAGAAGSGGTYPTGTLIGDFTELVAGAGESGCGIESQLESWYRFLIQPDPYYQIGMVGGSAVWQGVDTEILQERADFLRQDSLVAVIVLSDENDSEIDARAFGGTGYQFLSDTFSPPRATVGCFTNPADPTTCSTCLNCTSALCKADQNCNTNDGAYSESHDLNDFGYDLNTRHVHMAQKYSPYFLSAQYPLTRYWNGLTQATVPDRSGEYPAGASSYVGTNDCTNPLFAKTLPTSAAVANPMAPTATELAALCSLPGGAVRTPGDVFYAHIGGVPHELLQASLSDGLGDCPPSGHTAGTAPSGTTCGANQYYDTSVTPNACADCPQKTELQAADWVKILGQGPAAYSGTNPTVSYDYTGIDPHMVESEVPRNNNTVMQNPVVASVPAESTLQGPGFVATAADPVRPDPVNGREWTTNCATCTHSLYVDRQYACIFQLPPSSQRDCATLPPSTVEGNSCDCVAKWGGDAGTTAQPTGNTPDEVPPLCAKTSTDGTINSAVSDYTVQTYAKAYPTTRELTLANMMGPQGIVSSLCPIHTVDNTQNGNDPLYGYRPAVNAIVDRLKNALGAQCVPSLTPDSTGNVPCLVLVSFGPTVANPPTQGSCASYGGGVYSEPDSQVLAQFRAAETANAGDSGAAAALMKEPVCQLQQAAVPPGTSCFPNGGTGDKQGWCYVTGAGISGSSTCSQEILYSQQGLVPNGATISLQCISTNSATDAGTKAAGDGG
jgi:hypothetical protein